MLALRLPRDIEIRLDELARRTGRSMSSYAHQAIVEKMDELEAASRPGRTFSLDEIERLVLSRAPGAVVEREADRLIVQQPATSGLVEWLKTLEPLDEEFPDVDAGMPPLDEPDLLTEAEMGPSPSIRWVPPDRQHRRLPGPTVQRTWKAGTVKDGRRTLYQWDIEDCPGSAQFEVFRKDNRKRGNAERSRLDKILSGECQTVDDYRRAVGATLANADIAWDLNHDFYRVNVRISAAD